MRSIISLNDNWKFKKENVGLPAAYPTDWQTVDVPHMWGMILNFTIEGMIEMGNAEVPAAALAVLNAKLNEFDDIYVEEE